MQNIHPLFTHFPIVLLLIVPVIDLIGLVRREAWYHKASLRVLFLGVLAAIATVVTGLLAQETVSHSSEVVHELMETHEVFALATLGVAVAVLVWRLKVLNKLTTRLIIVILAVEIIAIGGLVGTTGWLGGELVYTHGVGTALTAQEPVIHEGDSHDHGH